MRGRGFLPLCLGLLLPVAALSAPWPRHTIDDSSRGADGVRLADVNGDGQMDIVTGWEEGDRIHAYLHPGPKGAANPWPAVTVGEVDAPEDAVFADLDGDGAMDVVSCCEGKAQSVYFHWAPKNEGDYLEGKAWSTEALPAAEGRTRWMFCLPMDMDGEHGIDLVVGSKQPHACIGWFKAPADPRDLGAWEFKKLCDASWIMSLKKIDLDGDGDEDILASDRKGARSRVLWLENHEGGWRDHTLGGVGEELMFLDTLPDGRVVVGAKDRRVLILRRGENPREEWKVEEREYSGELFGRAKGICAGDLDGDGEIDLAMTCESADPPKVGVFYLKGPEWRKPVPIADERGIKFDRIELLDLDGDGDLDLLTCEERHQLGVIWYENPAK